jgi:hypothetical protein
MVPSIIEEVPNPKTRTYSLEEFLKAMSIDGYEQGFGYLMLDNIGGPDEIKRGAHIISACAYGQALINLGVSLEAKYQEDFYDVYGETIAMNDRERLTPKQIARKLKARYKEDLRKTITVPMRFYGDEFKNYQGVKV